MTDTKDELLLSLRQARSGPLHSVEGLGEYAIRRPMTPTGTNLLGLVKHVASVQLGYLGDAFGRPSSIALPWFDEAAKPDDDLWVPAAQPTAEVLETARHAGHADVLRELVGGDAGRGPDDPNLTPRTAQEWADHRARIEAAARAAGDVSN